MFLNEFIRVCLSGLILWMVRNAFASRLHKLTMLSPKGPSIASHLVYDSNMSQIPMSNPPQYMSHDETLVKLHGNDSKVFYYHLTSSAHFIWPSWSHDYLLPISCIGPQWADTQFILMVHSVHQLSKIPFLKKVNFRQAHKEHI